MSWIADRKEKSVSRVCNSSWNNKTVYYEKKHSYENLPHPRFQAFFAQYIPQEPLKVDGYIVELH